MGLSFTLDGRFEIVAFLLVSFFLSFFFFFCLIDGIPIYTAWRRWWAKLRIIPRSMGGTMRVCLIVQQWTDRVRADVLFYICFPALRLPKQTFKSGITIIRGGSLIYIPDCLVWFLSVTSIGECPYTLLLRVSAWVPRIIRWCCGLSRLAPWLLNYGEDCFLGPPGGEITVVRFLPLGWSTVDLKPHRIRNPWVVVESQTARHISK